MSRRARTRFVGEPPGGRAVRRASHRLIGLSSTGVLVVGFALSALGARAWYSYVSSGSERSFASAATTAADALGLALQRDADLTATARTLVETSSSLTNQGFASWFQALGASSSHPGTFALFYIEKVPAAKLAQFARAATADPPLGLQVAGGFRLVPENAPPGVDCLTRYGVTQISPDTGIPLPTLATMLAFTRPDLNYCALPIGSLLRNSAAAGEPAAVAVATLIAETPHVNGLPTIPASVPAMFAKDGLIATLTPVYSVSGIPKTPAARLSSNTGWIFSIYQANSILGTVIRSGSNLAASLSYSNPSGGQRIVLAGAGSTAGRPMSRTFQLGATGDWYVTISGSVPEPGLGPAAQAWAVLGGGIVLAVLFYVLIRLLVLSRARAIELVDERTKQLRHQALHDSLTELPNRELIFDRAEQLLARVRRNGSGVAALFVDLDHFKDVNDIVGHAAGDQLLCEVARRLKAAVSAPDTVGRLDGDGFVVLLEVTPVSPSPDRVAGELIGVLRRPFHLGARGDRAVTVSASIGVAIGVRDSAGELLRDADIALNHAKAAGRGSFAIFRHEMYAELETRFDLEAEVRAAVRTGQLFLVYQPTYDLREMRVSGAEALLRWHHPTRGIVSPAEFIPTLEETGLIVEVGRFVLEEACLQAARWAETGHAIPVAVNASGRQLDDDDFNAVVGRALARSGLDPHLLTIEITESLLMRNTAVSARRLRALKQIGVSIAVDDFGSGYCSLAYLQKFPVDYLKIDRAFVSAMTGSPEGAALIHTIVQMGNDLNLETLAEGIETQAQLESLRAEGCARGQGNLLSPPVDTSAVTDLLLASASAERREYAGA